MEEDNLRQRNYKMEGAYVPTVFSGVEILEVGRFIVTFNILNHEL
jgi:hypothetical protein